MRTLVKKLIASIAIAGIIFQSFLPVVLAQTSYEAALAQIQAQSDAVRIQAQAEINQVSNSSSSNQTTQNSYDIWSKAQAIKDQTQAKIDDKIAQAQSKAQRSKETTLNVAQNRIQESTAAAENSVQTKTQNVLDSAQNSTAIPDNNSPDPILPQSQPSKYTGFDGDLSLNTGQVSAESQITNNVSFNKAKAMLEQMQNDFDQITIVTNDNENNINNKMEAFATSGKNILERNDGNAELLTGRVVINSAAITKNNVNEVSTPAQGNDVSNQVENKNKSLVENLVELIGDSGLNKIDTNDGKARIDTGLVDIRLNLLNLTNTNITNSEWGQLFYQAFEPLNQDFDLAKGWKQASRNDCAIGACEGEFKVTNVNEAVLNNKIKILGNSGGNEIKDSDGDGIIRTGDVKVSANLINFLNTNMTRAKWRLAVLNIFDDWKGDLILPGRDRFDDNANDYDLFPNSKITTENDANIKNSVVIETNTGDNEISSNDGKFNIQTGASVTKSNVSTLGNITFTGGDWYLVFINTFGGWKGYAVNVPEDIGMAQTEGGVIFSSLLSKAITGNLKKVRNDDGRLELMTDNVTELNNELLIQALTGNNKITGVDGNAEIITGNALVLSNIFNFVNTTMYGGKWNLALINVFGNWEGNITFGKPNLKLSQISTSPTGELKVGDAFTSKLLYENIGTADASDIVIKSTFDPKLFKVIASENGTVDQNLGKISWSLDKLKRGGTGNVNFTLQAIGKTVGVFDTKITSMISAKEREWELRDNTIETSLKVKITQNDISPPPPASVPQPNPPLGAQQNVSNNTQTNSGQSDSQSTNSSSQQQSNSNQNIQTNYSSDTAVSQNSSSSSVNVPKVTIKKTNDSKGILFPNDIVNYTILLENEGLADTGAIIVKDSFKDPQGKIISADEYPIPILHAKEGTAIQYSIAINPLLPSGKYLNTAVAYIKDKTGKLISTISASSAIEVKNTAISQTQEQNKDLNQTLPTDVVNDQLNKNQPLNLTAKTAEMFQLGKLAKATSNPTSKDTAKIRTQESPAKSDISITKIAYRQPEEPIFKFINAGSNLLNDLTDQLPRLLILFALWQIIVNIHQRVYTSSRSYTSSRRKIK